MNGKRITREGSSIKDAEDGFEKHIDPVSGYLYYLNVRTGETSWAHEDDWTESAAALTSAEDLHDNSVQLDQENNEWEIDRMCNSKVQWEIDETEYTGFGGGDDGKHVETSSHSNVRLKGGAEHETIDKVDMLLLNDKAESIPFDEYTPSSQPDKAVAATAEANSSSLVDDDSEQVTGRQEYDSNLHLECELDETSCHSNKVGTANESLVAPARRGNSCLAEIRCEKGQTEKEELLIFLTPAIIYGMCG